jgi:hypothetical protein
MLAMPHFWVLLTGLLNDSVIERVLLAEEPVIFQAFLLLIACKVLINFRLSVVLIFKIL